MIAVRCRLVDLSFFRRHRSSLFCDVHPIACNNTSSFNSLMNGDPPPFAASVTLMILLAILAVASQASNISLGSRITPTTSGSGWVSQNDTFVLKFYPSSIELYSVGILFNRITEETVAWTAGDNAQVGRNSSFELTQQGDLVLRDISLGKIYWNSNTNNLGVVGAAMLDNGNFVLLNSTSGTVWESFLNPTDTLLRGQQLNTNQSLTASPTSVTGSTYTAVMEASGNLSLKWNNITYWGSATTSESASYALLGDYTFEIHNATGSVKTWDSKEYTDTSIMIRRMKLDTDGNFRMYGWSSTTLSWINEWQAVQDQCYVYMWCGPYGICTYNATSPICSCPASAGFQPVDKTNYAKGCRRQVKLQNCDTQMSVLDHTILLDFLGKSSNSYNAGESECVNDCLKNRYCYAATSLNDGSGRCHLMLDESLVSGYASPQILSSSAVKTCSGTTAAPPTSSNLSSSSPSSISIKVFGVAVGGAIVGTLVAITLLQGAFWCLCCRKNSRFGRFTGQYALLEYASGAPIQFSFKDLQIATQNFKDKLGEGGFGAVYKGVLPNKTEIAVKQLIGRVDQGEKQFRVEVAIIGGTHHMNLVQLTGFCAEGKHRLLVYEFMRNGSLDKHLFDTSNSLDWERRFNVLLGTARGIMYLHQECRDPIIHCDIKPENILLDENFGAKVSDFGLAKLSAPGKDQMQTMTTVRGTRGYLAPEWRSNLPITTKSDVFSFGMVVLETISGRRNFDTSIGSSEGSDKGVKFWEWAYNEYFERRNVERVVDERLQLASDGGGAMEEEEGIWNEVERSMRVAYWCIQVQPSARPVMSKVVQLLEGTVEVAPPPMPYGEVWMAAGGAGDVETAELEQYSIVSAR